MTNGKKSILDLVDKHPELFLSGGLALNLLADCSDSAGHGSPIKEQVTLLEPDLHSLGHSRNLPVPGHLSREERLYLLKSLPD